MKLLLSSIKVVKTEGFRVCSNLMTYSSSGASQIKYVVFLCLLLISKLMGVASKQVSEDKFDPQVKYDVFVNFRGEDIRQVQRWRHALKKAANLSGIVSLDIGTEVEVLGEIINIVNLVLMKLDKHPLNLEGLVGIDKPIQYLESLLHQKSKAVLVIGIWGMGGIGKTTIAKEIFDRQYSKYDGYYFMVNVKEESGRHAIISLKEKLFSSILAENVKMNTAYGLSNYIRRRMGHMKVLIVFDDVTDLNLLEKLFGNPDWFGPGSRIIITTRDKQVLITNKADEIYEVQALNSSEAHEIFSFYAFDQSYFDMEYYKLSKRVVNYSKGIPLVLKVLGSLLRGKDKEIWESQLEKLKHMPNIDVYNVMRLSYDDLDRKEQQILLDLACFFVGLDLKVDHIKTLLKDSERDNSVLVGLERLKDKALITISKDNVVSMHDIIQEMAWEIVRQESIEDPGRRSRLRDPDDIYEVLQNDKRNFLPNLVIFDLSYSEVEKLWDGVQNLVNLKEVKVSGSKNLKELPDLSRATNLEVLDISFCPQLTSVIPSIFSLSKLKKLDLRACSLTKLTSDNHLSSLSYLNLGSCTKLKEFSMISESMIQLDLSSTSVNALPSSFECQSKLEMLWLRYSGIESLPSSFKNLISLRYLSVYKAKELHTITELPPSLETLEATDCTSLKIVFFPSIDEQLKENRKEVYFWNCLDLDEQSVKAIELNAHINVMKSAYQHLSAPDDNYHDYNLSHGLYQVKYVYPGSIVPEWLQYQTTKDDMIIDLSSTSHSSSLGFVFCFVVSYPNFKTIIGHRFTFYITISDYDDESKKDSIDIYMSDPYIWLLSDHVCVVYDQRCSRYLSNRAKNQTRFKLTVKAEAVAVARQRGVGLKGFGVSPIYKAGYHNFMEDINNISYHNFIQQINTSADHSAFQQINISADHSVFQPINTSADHNVFQQINTSADHSVFQPINTSVDHSVFQQINTSADHSVFQPIDTSADRSFFQPMEVSESMYFISVLGAILCISFLWLRYNRLGFRRLLM
ncbi:hypothetical protein VNO77_07397 [Canavalia gladiata]|uniref:ADP-ribosyl cyclase/cyclic ADP-ribose hydrolase n=1 Tax=Canavalia gladiata TaxID=3824 RepID=A0AAN9QTD5_CANGL